MALGAFIAGLLLAETEYRREIEAIIDPFKGILLGTYFLLVGMGMNLKLLLSYPLLIVGLAIGLIAVKGIIIYAAGSLFRISKAARIRTALLLGPDMQLDLSTGFGLSDGAADHTLAVGFSRRFR